MSTCIHVHCTSVVKIIQVYTSVCKLYVHVRICTRAHGSIRVYTGVATLPLMVSAIIDDYVVCLYMLQNTVVVRSSIIDIAPVYGLYVRLFFYDAATVMIANDRTNTDK